MQGLSDVIRDVDPHVICLQEVTPNILGCCCHAQPWFEQWTARRAAGGSTSP